MIRLSSFNRNPSVGVFARCNDTLAIAAPRSSEGFIKDLSELLDVHVHCTEAAQTGLIGAMIAMNNKGVVLPRNITASELAFFQSLDIKTGVIDDNPTALGNLILTNDNGAVVSSLFSSKARKEISDVLEVEVAAKDFQGFRTVGSIGVSTSKGVLMHAQLSDEDLEFIENILKVRADIGTINRGVGYIRTGLLANSKGALIGSSTTSPEISRIEDALELL